MQRHLKEELDLKQPGAYVSNYNNVGWGAQVRGPSCRMGGGEGVGWVGDGG